MRRVISCETEEEVLILPLPLLLPIIIIINIITILFLLLLFTPCLVNMWVLLKVCTHLSDQLTASCVVYFISTFEGIWKKNVGHDSGLSYIAVMSK